MNRDTFVLFVLAVAQSVSSQTPCKNSQQALVANSMCQRAIDEYEGDIICNGTCGPLLAKVANDCWNSASNKLGSVYLAGHRQGFLWLFYRSLIGIRKGFTSVVYVISIATHVQL